MSDGRDVLMVATKVERLEIDQEDLRQVWEDAREVSERAALRALPTFTAFVVGYSVPRHLRGESLMVSGPVNACRRQAFSYEQLIRSARYRLERSRKAAEQRPQPTRLLPTAHITGSSPIAHSSAVPGSGTIPGGASMLTSAGATMFPKSTNPS